MRRVSVVFCFILIGNSVTAGNLCESAAEEVQQVCRAVNQLRNREGVDPVRVDRHLNRVAESYARTLAKRGELTHGNFRKRMVRAGVRMPAAENIAVGQETPKGVVKDWTRSPGHFRNMTSGRFKRIGVGYHDKYWVQIFSVQ